MCCIRQRLPGRRISNTECVEFAESRKRKAESRDEGIKQIINPVDSLQLAMTVILSTVMPAGRENEVEESIVEY
ncbi:MAG: hypothetical protein KAT07_10450 [Calditrichia bacterium]|nr:hypothetical protein [Calditrichia bacterium]